MIAKLNIPAIMIILLSEHQLINLPLRLIIIRQTFLHVINLRKCNQSTNQQHVANVVVLPKHENIKIPFPLYVVAKHQKKKKIRTYDQSVLLPLSTLSMI